MPRTPENQAPLPPADAIIAAPLTFNSLNKWAAGISDTLALGLLSEALGLKVSISAALCIKDALRKHPAYDTSVRTLAAAGVNVLPPTTILASSTSGSVNLDWDLVAPAI